MIKTILLSLMKPTILVGGQAVKKLGSAAAGQAAKSVLQGGTSQTAKNVATNVAGAGATGWKNLGKNWFSGDPLVKGSKWGWKTLTSPTANTLDPIINCSSSVAITRPSSNLSSA